MGDFSGLTKVFNYLKMSFPVEYPELPNDYLAVGDLPDLRDILGSFTTNQVHNYGPQHVEVKQEEANYPMQNYNHAIPVVDNVQQQHIQLLEGLEQQQDNFVEELQPNSHVPSFIASNEFGGEYDFEVEINPHHGKKSPWVYSSALNKIFIVMNQLFPIDFKCNYPNDDRKLFIRATPIYSQSQHAGELVTRCINHAHGAETTNKECPEKLWDHVIRCYHRLASYGGSRGKKHHLFVRVPLLKTNNGCDSHQLQFKFMCKNSCGSETGMNRRPIDVVFTLEDEMGSILGRRVLSVRICSCPKRDKEKDESEYYRKEEPEKAVQHGKRRKLDKKPTSQELVDQAEYKLEIPVIGSANAKAVMKYVYDMMAGEMVRHNMQQPYKGCLMKLDQMMNSPLK